MLWSMKLAIVGISIWAVSAGTPKTHHLIRRDSRVIQPESEQTRINRNPSIDPEVTSSESMVQDRSGTNPRPVFGAKTFGEAADKINEAQCKNPLHMTGGSGNWRQTLVPTAYWALGTGLRKSGRSGEVYQFGVFDGDSMFDLQKMFPRAKVWGFDSFEGLPKEAADAKINPNWKENSFHATVKADDLQKRLSNDTTRAEIIVGFYSDTLNTNLLDKKQFQPAIYVDMDANLYISSFQALDWMFKSKIIRKGTLIGYGNWWANSCSAGGEELDPLETGEGRAHVEVVKKYGVQMRCVGGPCQGTDDARLDYTNQTCTNDQGGPVFLVIDIGKHGDDEHGFSMNEKDVSKYRKSTGCQNLRQGQGHDGKERRAETMTSATKGTVEQTITSATKGATEQTFTSDTKGATKQVQDPSDATDTETTTTVTTTSGAETDTTTTKTTTV